MVDMPLVALADRPQATQDHPPSVRRPMNAIRRFFKNDQAIAVTEYGLLIALIAVVLIVAVFLFGNAISSWFGSKTGQITTY